MKTQHGMPTPVPRRLGAVASALAGSSPTSSSLVAPRVAALPPADLDWGDKAAKFWYAGGKGARVQRHEVLDARRQDLARRVDELGMAPAARDFAETGVCVVHDAIPLELCEALTQLLTAGAAESLELTKGRNGQQGDLLTKYEKIEQLLVLPKVRTLSEVGVGVGCVLSQLLSSVRGDGSRGLACHCDIETGDEYVDPPSATRVCDQLQIVFALDGDWDADSGPSFVIPSSFKEARPPQESDWERITTEAVALTMPRGSIAAWHGYTWHGSLPRKLESGFRVGVHLTLMRQRPRPFQDFSRRVDYPEGSGWAEMVARSAEPDTLRSLLGVEGLERERGYQSIANGDGTPIRDVQDNSGGRGASQSGA